MTAHDPNLAPRGLWHWLGFGTNRHDVDFEGEEDRQAQVVLAESPQDKLRRASLDEVCRFVQAHHLPVNGFTLTVAHEIASGTNPELARLVAGRIARREPVTLTWLEDAMEAEGRGNGEGQIEALVERLESAIVELGSTASAARSATSDYHSALEAHVVDLSMLSNASSVILELTSLTREMLNRTREIERELSRSERETQSLQQSLADARRDAEIDHLTGLPNRRAFESELRREYAETRAAGEHLCVAFCDIDHFKLINDVHGHDAGDRILRTVAQSLAAVSDDKCHVARHGGEEFVVLLRGILLKEACRIIDGARDALAARRLINRSTDVPFGPVTFSAGVADAHAYANAREALRAADSALFEAKSKGRNRVYSADPALGSARAFESGAEEHGSGI